MNVSSEKPVKVGVRIEKPATANIHPTYPFLIWLSLALIGLTVWLLVLEHLGEPPPMWLRRFLETFRLMF